MTKFLLFLWQLPQNIVGFIVYIICKLRERGSITYKDKITTLWLFPGGLSMGLYMFVYKDYDENLIQHEYGHTIQSLYLGPVYLLIIGIPSLIWAGCFQEFRRKHKISYYSFYPEKWADKLGGVKRD